MKHNKKDNKEIIKKGITTLILLFFGMVIVFQKEPTNAEIQFVRNTNGIIAHNAAQDRSYLFEDEGGQQVYQGQLQTGDIVNMSTGKNYTGNVINGTGDTTKTIDSLIDPKEIAQIVGDTKTGENYTGNSSGAIYSGEINTGIINTGTQSSKDTGNITTGTLDCITPWKAKIKNKDFVLAYQQRKDVNSICNIEKRICTDGILGGSFSQNSCKEDMVYTYRKAEVISYNQKILNEYIQTAPPINSGADFDNEGKINTVEKPTNKRGTKNNPVITKTSTNQTPLSTKKSCTSPRGQTVQHGQFIKTYKAPRGFIDLACEVEIRPCIDGNLKGNFNYQKCTFNNTTYTEYLNAGSPMSNTGFLFFERIKSKFNTRK